MKQQQVSVVARVKARKGFEERVRHECLALVAPSRRESGCLNYDLHQSIDDPTLFLFYENWTSREDLERHLETAHALAFDERTAGMLEEPEEVTLWEMIG
ncbi:MAG TPA: putative quinol monooxygenase [Pyrinomonadaceae bacterium]|jgi:quinol monooxygenase YgiN|nr:putative quinol monooxygenase [Pyrinomonadaceae bacterium]